MWLDDGWINFPRRNDWPIWYADWDKDLRVIPYLIAIYDDGKIIGPFPIVWPRPDKLVK